MKVKLKIGDLVKEKQSGRIGVVVWASIVPFRKIDYEKYGETKNHPIKYQVAFPFDRQLFHLERIEIIKINKSDKQKELPRQLFKRGGGYEKTEKNKKRADRLTKKIRHR